MESKRLHRKFHHQTSLRGSGLWWALDFSSRPWRNLPPTWAIHMATRRPAHNTPIHMDSLYRFLQKRTKSMWIGVLSAGLRVAMACASPMWGGQISPWPVRKVTDIKRKGRKRHSIVVRKGPWVLRYMTIDRVFSTIGSFNFDLYSARRNLEVGIAVFDHDLAVRLQDSGKKQNERGERCRPRSLLFK